MPDQDVFFGQGNLL